MNPEQPPRRGKRRRYHHGDLRTALVDAAIELIAENGVRNFSLAEASRRVGVAVSAPYSHFADRDELLAAVAVRAYEQFAAGLEQEVAQLEAPAERLAATARAYVRFAAVHRPLFEVLFEAGLDKQRHPEMAAAEKPITDAFLASVRAVTDDGAAESEALATAVEAAAHGHAMLLLDGSFGRGIKAPELAAEKAARATLALIESRHLLTEVVP